MRKNDDSNERLTCTQKGSSQVLIPSCSFGRWQSRDAGTVVGSGGESPGDPPHPAPSRGPSAGEVLFQGDKAGGSALHSDLLQKGALILKSISLKTKPRRHRPPTPKKTLFITTEL